MPSAKYPSNILETKLRERGISVRCLWQENGPKNTAIAWQECLLVNGTPVIVQTFASGGWQAYTPNQSNDVEATINDVIERTKTATDDE
jgi:hypothetical protein